MPHLAKTLSICAVVLLLGAVPASADPPRASAAAKCSVRGIERKLGAQYVNELSTRRVSCGDAKDFSKRYHRCRRARGGRKGTCPRLLRFRCTEKRFNKLSYTFDSRVLCTRGSQRIRMLYTQDT